MRNNLRTDIRHGPAAHRPADDRQRSRLNRLGRRAAAGGAGRRVGAARRAQPAQCGPCLLAHSGGYVDTVLDLIMPCSSHNLDIDQCLVIVEVVSLY